MSKNVSAGTDAIVNAAIMGEQTPITAGSIRQIRTAIEILFQPIAATDIRL